MKGTVYMDKSKIRRLADYAVRQCCDHSQDCYWTISYDELYYHFGAEVTDSNENGKLLEEELRLREVHQKPALYGERVSRFNKPILP